MKQRKQREKAAQELEINRFQSAKRMRQNAGTAPILSLREKEKRDREILSLGYLVEIGGFEPPTSGL